MYVYRQAATSIYYTMYIADNKCHRARRAIRIRAGSISPALSYVFDSPRPHRHFAVMYVTTCTKSRLCALIIPWHDVRGKSRGIIRYAFLRKG